MLKIVLVIVSILVVIVLLFLTSAWIANILFDKKVTKEVTELFKNVDTQKEVIRKADLERLPLCVQKWLESSGVVGKERIGTVRLKQKGLMRSKPAGAWLSFAAEQYFTVAQPAFIWKASVQAAPLLHLVARDKYEDGKGNMLIKFQSLISIADSKGKEIDQGTLLRYLAETTWFPTATLCDYITWEAIDSTSVRATMSYGDVTALGVFRFNEQGDIASFEAQRYGEFDGKYSIETWLITVKDSKSIHGIRIPYASEVTWKLKSGDFNWLKLEIIDLEYNTPIVYE